MVFALVSIVIVCKSIKAGKHIVFCFYFVIFNQSGNKLKNQWKLSALSIYKVRSNLIKELVLAGVNGKRRSTPCEYASGSCAVSQVSMPKGLEIILHRLQNSALKTPAHFVSIPRGSTTQRTRLVRPKPVLSVLRTDPCHLHLRTGRPLRPHLVVLANGKRPFTQAPA